mgnify:CR=1 FL=1
MQYRFGSYRPDAPRVGAPDKDGRIDLAQAQNVYRTADGYLSTPSPVAQTVFGNLTAKCQGAAGVRMSDGTRYLVAGDATKLYLTGSGALVDRTGAAVPALSTSQRWSIAAFDRTVLATSLGVAGIQGSTGAAFSTLDANAPQAGHVFVLKEFVVAADIVGRGVNAGLGVQRDALQWSGRGEFTGANSWLAPGTDAALARESSWQPLRGETGPITLALSAGTYGIICRERSIWRMDYVGGAEIMNIEPLEENFGCLVNGCGVAVGGNVYFPSESGFVRTDGEKAYDIGFGKINRTWRDSLTGDDRYLMSAAHDFERQQIWFQHPGSGVAWIYSYATDDWTMSVRPAEWIFNLQPIAESMDTGSMSAANMDTTFGSTNMDALGGTDTEELAVFNAIHGVSTLTGAGQITQMRTKRFQCIPDSRSLVRSIRPFTSNGDQVLAVQGYLTPDEADKSPSYSVVGRSGLAPVRAGGRYHELSALFVIDEELEGFDVILQEQGVR